uniref:Uncharacterized protein n=1 Tax=Pithovirus LCPAC104 TaxID=2506589 RepID=A0A481Z490_9VIRU|nr:MAG: hypothetical protein LCPAC104_01710 [Pithovirus LCPAC104]
MKGNDEKEKKIEKWKIDKSNHGDGKLCYSEDTIDKIQLFYIIAIILWIIMIIFLKIDIDLIAFLLFTIPIIVYLINFHNVEDCSVEVENEIFKGDFLSFAVFIVLIFMNWNKKSRNVDVFKLLVIAVIFITLSLIDFWVPKNKIILVKHFRSILNTASLSILAIALYIYYREDINNKDKNNREIKLVKIVKD